jgi:hypothetical protein
VYLAHSARRAGSAGPARLVHGFLDGFLDGPFMPAKNGGEQVGLTLRGKGTT